MGIVCRAVKARTSVSLGVLVVLCAAGGVGAFRYWKSRARADEAPEKGPACQRDLACAEVRADDLEARARQKGQTRLRCAAIGLRSTLGKGDCDAATELAHALERIDVSPDDRELADSTERLLFGVQGYCESAQDDEGKGRRAGPIAWTVTMRRNACEGDCPVYEVTLTSEGEVSYEGRVHVKKVGAARARVSTAEAGALYASFERLHFATLPHEYCPGMRDAGDAELSLTIGTGAPIVVRDYCGGDACEDGVGYLEARVDEVARTSQYVGP